MQDIKLIALDLDGTLLNSEKALSPRNRAALAAAAARGLEIVPATGRFFGGMPEEIRTLPFVRYAVTINGAAVRDMREDRDVYTALLPLDLAIRILAALDALPVIYDCYMDHWGWMTEEMQRRAAEFAPDRHYLKMIRELRTPVPELKAFLRERGQDVQKVQLFSKDPALRERLLRELAGQFADIAVTTSAPNNIEINHLRANKGDALVALGAGLGIRPEQIMVFGDGLNDVPMLRQAGVGVAMGNAAPEVRAAADLVTASCDQDGVAEVLETLLAAGA